MKAKTKLKLASLTDEYNMLVQLLIALQEGGNEPTKKGVLFWNETEDIGAKRSKDGSMWVFNSEGWKAKVRDERVVGVLDELTGK